MAARLATSYRVEKTARPVHDRVARAATTESHLTGLPLADVLLERERVARLEELPPRESAGSLARTVIDSPLYLAARAIPPGRTKGEKMAKQPERFAVVYRTGGTARFKWNRLFRDFTTREVADAAKAELERQGYAAHVHDAALLDAIGLPETYGGGVGLEGVRIYNRGDVANHPHFGIVTKDDGQNVWVQVDFDAEDEAPGETYAVARSMVEHVDDGYARIVTVAAYLERRERRERRTADIARRKALETGRGA
ncbi:MAG: hypothetical protein OEW52_00275 [Thermoleophilia bacterium]|nr:hypothetical protein [Thermoleophilia bacterium]